MSRNNQNVPPTPFAKPQGFVFESPQAATKTPKKNPFESPKSEKFRNSSSSAFNFEALRSLVEQKAPSNRFAPGLSSTKKKPNRRLKIDRKKGKAENESSDTNQTSTFSFGDKGKTHQIPIQIKEENVPSQVSFSPGLRSFKRKGPMRSYKPTIKHAFIATPNQETHVKIEKKAEDEGLMQKRVSADKKRSEGNKLYREGLYEQAAALYSEAIRLNSSDVTFYANRAAAYLMSSRFHDAIEDCKILLKKDPSCYKGHLRAGRAYLALGEVVASRKHYSDALASKDSDILSSAKTGLEKVDTFASALRNARHLLGAGEAAKATRFVDEALRHAPDYIDLKVLKVKTMLQLHDIEKAVHFCESQIGGCLALKNGTQPFIEPSLQFGLVYSKALSYAGMVTESSNVLKAMSLTKADHPELKSLVDYFKKLDTSKEQANKFFKAGLYRRATDLYTDSLRLDAFNDFYNSRILCNRAAAFIEMGQWEAAVTDCKSALMKRPTYFKAQFRLGSAYLKGCRFSEAISSLEKAAVFGVSTKEQLEAKALANRARTEQHAASKRRQQREQAAREQRRRFEQQRKKPREKHWGKDKRKYQQQNNIPGVKRVSLYTVLGVNPSSTEQEIKKSFHKLALKHHPDKAKDASSIDRFKEINHAYSVLSSPTQRRRYDLGVFC